ncbi:triose-phosphate isomerase [Oryzifoliimicrobium ureilyticus]|uniref:triose-phosphate isomerase n=1 Tax=Oryzifoliimicrobium ureilyticus TaxID=3113724 RepID=UPI0030760A9B
MRKLVVGNWKMNGLAASLAEIEALKGLTSSATCEIVVCPPFTLIERATARSHGSSIAIGAQDCHSEATGAYTGDVSAQMLAEIGARFVIVGHSERRSTYQETDMSVAAKARAAHAAGLTSIICVGETQSERDLGKAIEIVTRQVIRSMPTSGASENTAIAYEPRWAIGSGLVPSISQVEDVHAAIRETLVERVGADGRAIRILYGGSLKPSNAASIFSIENVDGGLIGGASLKASDFTAIIAAAG